MKIKIIKTVLIGLLFLFMTSWFYKIICLILLSLVWKKTIISKFPYRYTFRYLMILFAVCIFAVLPRYRYNTSDRVRLIYQDKKGNPILPPLSHYLVNVLMPEEDIMNVCIHAARLGVTCFPFVGGGTLLHQFQHDSRNWKIMNFYHPISKLNWSGQFLMSGTTSQVGNMIGLPATSSVYLIRPKHFDPDKKYPVVFFCHGGLGNWKLYQGLWKDLEDCIVLSIGTRDWNGFFGYGDIQGIFTTQLPFLKKMGFKVDETKLHIMGLSNGGTAVNMAYNKFSRRFRSITFISTGIHQTHPVNSKIILIGGGLDGSSRSLPGAYKQLKKQGSSSAIYWDDKATHFILVNQQNKILKFLNTQMLNH